MTNDLLADRLPGLDVANLVIGIGYLLMANQSAKRF
jgi:hypothetical protein